MLRDEFMQVLEALRMAEEHFGNEGSDLANEIESARTIMEMELDNMENGEFCIDDLCDTLYEARRDAA